MSPVITAHRARPARLLRMGFLLIPIVVASLSTSLRAQCTEAERGSLTLYLFDLTSPDMPQDQLHRFLDILTFQLNSGIRDDLKSRGLLGKAPLAVRWCSGAAITMPNDAVERGRKLGSSGVMWGVVDRGSGRLKSALKLTTVGAQPITGLSNIIYGQKQSELVDNSYIAFAAYLLGKQHLRDGNNSLARRSFIYARDRRSLPDALQKDLEKNLGEMDQANHAKSLAPVGRASK